MLQAQVELEAQQLSSLDVTPGCPATAGWCLPAFLPPGALVHRAAYDIKNHTSIIKKSYFHQDLSLIFV